MGIRVRLHYTWIIAFILMTLVLQTQFSETYPMWQRLVLGMGGSLLFFVAVSIRVLVITSLTVSRGMSVENVTLFVLGGVYGGTRADTTPVYELLLAMAGLLSNLIVVGLFYAAYIGLLNTDNNVLASLILWLAYLYSILTIFHFIPAFPLDGGRAFRVLLWKLTSSYDRAARIARWTGMGTGIALLAWGILDMVLTRQYFVGVLLIFIGWVMLSAVRLGRNKAIMYEALKGVRVQDVMVIDYPFIDQHLTLKQLVHDYVLPTGQRYFVITEGAKLLGVVTMRDIRKVNKKRWDSTSVGEIMTPVSRLKTAYLKQTGVSLLGQMEDFRLARMPVLERDKVVGVVTRESVDRFVKVRTELKV